MADTAWVVQGHVIAMFAPSLFTGWLIDRFGLGKMMRGGIILMIFCVVIALIGHHLIHYWTSLFILGVGWNFLFVGGTTLLTRTYRPVERFKAQAFNDFTVYGFQATASLSAGAVIFYAGWKTVNLALPLLLITFGVLVWLGHRNEI